MSFLRQVRNWTKKLLPSALSTLDYASSKPNARPILELLEDRTLPSISSMGFADAFDQANTTLLNSPWHEQTGDFVIEGQSLLGLQQVNVATMNGMSNGEVTLQVNVMKVESNTSVGLVSRYSSANQMYWGGVVNRTGTLNAEIWRMSGGRWQLLGGHNVFALTGQMKFETLGSSLRLYWNQELITSATDDAIASQGSAGLYVTGGNVIDDFQINLIQTTPPSLPFADPFSAADQSSPDEVWLNRQGSFVVQSQELVGRQAVNIATVQGLIRSDVILQSNIVSVAPGTSAGLVSRYSDTGQMIWGGVVNQGGFAKAELWRQVSGRWQLLTSQNIGSASGQLRLETVGSNVKLYWNQQLAGSTIENLVTEAGAAGVFAIGGNILDDFQVRAVGNPLSLPYEDGFIQLSGSQLIEPWQVKLGTFVVQSQAAVGSQPLNIATLRSVAETDLVVQADLQPVAIGTSTGLISRYINANNMYWGGIVNSSGMNKAEIWRMTNGQWQLLSSQAIGSEAGQLRFETSGSSLRLYWDQQLAGEVSDLAITAAGSAGIYASGGNILDNVHVSSSGEQLITAPSFVDASSTETTETTEAPASSLEEEPPVIEPEETISESEPEPVKESAPEPALHDFVYSLIGDGVDDNLTLRVNGEQIELVDDTTDAILASTPLATTGAITINGSEDGETLTVDFFNGNPAPVNGVTFHGNGPAELPGDALVIDGVGFDSVVYQTTEPTSGNFIIDGSSIIRFTGLEPTTVNSPAADFMIDVDPVDDVDGLVTSILDDGPDEGEFSGHSIVTFDNDLESVSFRVPANSLTINGDPNDPDQIIVNGVDFFFDAAINLVGQTGDIVDFNDPLSNVPMLDVQVPTVNLNVDLQIPTIMGTATTIYVAAGASIQDAIDMAASGATIIVAPGTYAESLTIDKSLTLRGATGNASSVVIDPPGGNGINIIASATTVTIEDLQVTGAADGIFANGVSGTLTFDNVESISNSGDGFDLNNVGDIVMIGATATGNDPGVLVNGAASYSDTDGNYSNNNDHGIRLIDIAGDVTLIRTNLDDNDADNDGIGDGLNATGDGDSVAIGGNLLVQGVIVRDSDGNGAAEHQEHGIFVDGITGTATFEDSTGVVQSNTVTGHDQDGVVIYNAAAVNISAGTFSSNADNGIEVANITGAVTLTNSVNADLNFTNGLFVNTAGSVSVTGGSFSENDIDGIRLESISGAVTMTGGVTAENQRLGAGVEVFGAASVSIGGGSFSNNDDDGIFLQSITGAVTLTNSVTADENGLSGLFVSTAGSVSISGGSFSNNDADDNGTGDGISLNNVGAVTTTNVTATGNDPGMFINGAASFLDTDGVFSGNDDHGIQLIDIAGNVTLIRTELEDNDADDDGIGDGLNATVNVNAAAIGGNLVVQGATIQDTDGVGTTAWQERGVFVESIAGSVTFEDSTVTVQSVTVTGHDQEGVLIQDGGINATFTDGNYSSNAQDNIQLASFSGTATLTDVTSDTSTSGDGLQIENTGIVVLSGGTYSDNGDNGIRLSSITTSISLTSVTANLNDSDGLNIDSTAGGTTGDVTISMGSYSQNDDDGIDMDDVGAVMMTDVTADSNFNGIDNGGGVFIDTAESVTITNGSYSSNVNDGIELDNIPSFVTLTNVTADNTVQFNGLQGDNIGGTTTISGGSYSSNNTDGIDLNLVADVVLTNSVSVTGNQRGVIIITAESFSDTDGNISNNEDHGIELMDISGNVTLIRTTLDDNDADTDGTGDGLNVSDGGDADNFAIGGNLLVQGAQIHETAGGQQQNGIIVSNATGTPSIGGNATFEDSAGAVQSVEVTGHQQDGINLDGVAGEVSVSNVAATDNGATGMRVAGAGSVTAMNNSAFSDNGLQGLHLTDINGAVQLTSMEANMNGQNGLVLVTAASLTVGMSTFSNNSVTTSTGDGMDVVNISGAVNLTDVVASQNDVGVIVRGAGVFTDTDGEYRLNVDGGIVLEDIDGNVTLVRTTLEDNDSDNIGFGDGLRVSDGGDGDNLGIGGDLRVLGAIIRDTDLGGTSVFQVNGVIADRIGGAMLFQNSTGTVQSNTIAGHVGFGVAVTSSGTTASFSDGDYSDNGSDGIFLNNFTGSINLASVTANRNGGDGLRVDDGGPVGVTSGSYSNNAGDGIDLTNVGAVTATNVTAGFNGNDGLRVTTGGAIQVDSGSYSDNIGDGIDLAGVGAVVFTNVTADSNNIGALIDGAQSFSDTGGSFESNDNGGIVLIDISGDVTLVRTLLHANDDDTDGDGDGLRATDGGDIDDFAIGGDLVVRRGMFTGDGAGQQINGLYLAGAIATGSIISSQFEDNRAAGLSVSNGGLGSNVLLAANDFVNNNIGVHINDGYAVEFATGNVIENGATSSSGLRVSGVNAGIVNRTLGNTTFRVPMLEGGDNINNNYITIDSGALSMGNNLPLTIDAMSAVFGAASSSGTTGATLTEPVRQLVEARIYDFLDERDSGFIILKPRVSFLDTNEGTLIDDLIVIGSRSRDIVNIFGSNAAAVSFTMAGANGQQTHAGNNVNLSAGGQTFLFTLDGEDLIKVIGNTAARVFGGRDDDRMYGGISNSIYLGEEGNDYFRGGMGAETFFGGDDIDMLVDMGAGDSHVGIDIVVP